MINICVFPYSRTTHDYLLSDEITLPSSVDFGNLLQGKSRGLDDKVIDRKLVLALRRLVKHLTKLADLIHINLNGDIVVGNSLLGFGQTATNDAAHVGGRNISEGITSSRLGSVSCGGGSSGSSSSSSGSYLTT